MKKQKSILSLILATVLTLNLCGCSAGNNIKHVSLRELPTTYDYR